MKTRLWMVCVGAVGAAALIATLRAASSQSVFLSKAVPVMSGAAVLGTEEYDPPDPNDPNDMTGIAGYLGAYDPNDPNQDPNDPLSVPPICEAVIHAMQDGEFVGSAMSGLLDSPDEGVYFIPRLDEDTYDLKIIAPGHAVELITGIEVGFGFPTVVNIFDLQAEGRVTGRITDSEDELLDPNDVYVRISCPSDILLMTNPDANGIYEIGNIPAGTYTVEAISQLVTFTPQSDVSVTSGQTTSEVDFVGAAEGSISGRITDSSSGGLGPNEVHVSVDCGTGGMHGEDPNADGYYLIERVPVGTYTVRVLSATHSLEPEEDVVVTVGEETTDVDFQAAAEGTITGKVFESDGETPIDGAHVTAWPVPTGRNASIAVTDPNGFYLLVNVPPDSNYTVEVTYIDDPNDPDSLGNEVGRTSGVLVTAGQNTSVDLVAPAGAISGSLSPAVEGALVRALGPEGSSLSVYETATDPNGDYTLTSLPAGTYDVSLEAPGYHAPKLTEIEVAQVETTGHDFTLTTGGAISGLVTDTLSEPIAGAVVVAMDPNADPTWIAPVVMTDEEGLYSLGYLAAGTYIVTVDANDHDGDSTTDVVVTAGQTTEDIDFSLGATGSKITGTVYESDGVTPIPGAVVACYGDGLTRRFVIADEVGDYELPWLMAGTYTVAAVGDEFEPDEITDVVVTAGNTTTGVDFQLDAEP